jgi:glutamyl-tRNA reductase
LTDKEIALIRPAEIGLACEPRSIVVIATTDVNDEYAAMLRNALLRLEPRAIIDLSSMPVLSSSAVGKLNYVTMYDEVFLSYVEKNNKQLAARLPLVCSEIEATIGVAQVIIS